MSFDIPTRFESKIEEFAHSQHITHDEALIQLLQAGLDRLLPAGIQPRDILGAFSSPEERVIEDEALELAMKDRERRNAQVPHA